MTCLRFLEDEDHLLCRVVEGSFGEGAVLFQGHEAGQGEKGMELRIGVVGHVQALGFFADDLAALVSTEEKCEVNDLVDFVHGIFAVMAADDFGGISGKRPLEFGNFVADG